MNKFAFLIFLVGIVFNASAHEYRNLLQKQADIATVKKALVLNQKWVTYPNYNDRVGWDALTYPNLSQTFIK